MSHATPHRVASLPIRLTARLVGGVIILFASLITAVRGIWKGIGPDPRQRVYFANHASNGDFILIWTVLPPRLRARTRPVAAADYWLASRLRAFIGRDVFHAVLIDRTRSADAPDPVGQMVAALDEGASLILFPEGMRNATTAPLLPFRTGLYHLARQRPAVDLVPVWIANLNRVMPKGEVIPIPLICTVTFGAPLHLRAEEPRDAFLERASDALRALAPQAHAPAAPSGNPARAPGSGAGS